MEDSELRPAGPPHQTSGRRGVIGALLVGLAIGALAMWFMRAPSTSGAADPTETAESDGAELPPGILELPEAAQRNTAVQIVEVTTSTLPATIEVTGAVTPDDARVARIRPLAKGVVQSVAVRLGDRVNRGAVLATLDNVELGTLAGEYLSLEAELRQAEAERDVRQKAVDRARELIKLEGISQQQLEQRESELKNAEASIASRRARVAQVEEQIHRFGVTEEQLKRLASPGAAHRTESLSVLRAPFGGIVTKHSVAPGELVDPDRELFTIADISTVWVMGDVYEKDIASIQRGTKATIRVDAYPDRVFTGQLAYISDVIDPQTRTAKVRCVVTNDDGALKVDMFARITIPTKAARAALVIPAAAIQQIDGESVVFVRQTATRFERRAVKVGATAGDRVEIRDGVKPGESIVGSGSFYLKTAALRERIAED